MFHVQKSQLYTAVIVGAGIGRVFDAIKVDPHCENLRLSRSSIPAIDYDTPQSLEEAATQISTEVSSIDVLIIATGALTAPNGTPPEKSVSQLTAEAMEEIFRINTIGPAITLKAFTPLLARDRRTLTATLSARVGSIGDNALEAGSAIALRKQPSTRSRIALRSSNRGAMISRYVLPCIQDH